MAKVGCGAGSKQSSAGDDCVSSDIALTQENFNFHGLVVCGGE